jgi:S1-C subfamily serine protease
MHNMTANKDSFVHCSLVLADTTRAIDLAILQTTAKKLPAGAKPVKAGAAMMNEDSLRPGSRAIMVGFPKGMDLARLPNGKIKTQVYEGFINKESDGVQIQYDITSDRGASGSPVFNECGRLIAINYAGYIETQGFNFGILAKHAVYLLGKQRLATPAVAENP